MKVIIVHGNHGGTGDDEWIPWLTRELTERGVEALNPTMPDNEEAKASVWLPQLEALGADAETVIVGWSSGGVAAMRYAETHALLGSVLVGVNHSDLNDPLEQRSGYYDHPWHWEKIRANQEWIVQYASSDDPASPIEEARAVHAFLGTEYYEYTDRKHFGWPDPMPEFPELLDLLLKKLI